MQIRGIGVNEVVVQGIAEQPVAQRARPRASGTPLPGQPGNAVIAGRRTLYGGPFRHIGSLHRGDRIHVTTGEGNATYRVSSVTVLAADDGSFVQNHGDNRLTLFTTDSPWTASGRLVVTATLIGNPFPPTTSSATLDADGLGLTGERDAAPYMLVWLEFLAGAALFTAYAASRWSAPRVWLVFAPVLAVTDVALLRELCPFAAGNAVSRHLRTVSPLDFSDATPASCLAFTFVWLNGVDPTRNQPTGSFKEAL